MIDATVGGMTANSYVTLTEAEGYFTERLGGEAWMGASAGRQEQALLSAVRALERLRWLGNPAGAAQGLRWPRRGVIGCVDGVVPPAIRQAQCEEALALLTPEVTRRRLLQDAGVSEAQVDGLRERYRPLRGCCLRSAEARALVGGLTACGAVLVRDDAEEVGDMGMILPYLVETATLYGRIGVDAYGDPRYDTGREVRCRVRLQRVMARLHAGEERACPGEVWLAPDETIAPGDRLLYDGEYLSITSVASVTDMTGGLVGLRAQVG